MAKVLVTGGTGYIGSHTVVELQKKGYEVLIADNLCNSRIETLDNIAKITGVRPEFEKIDLAEVAQTADFFERHSDIDSIIHFAAYKAVGDSVTNPISYYKNNMFSMINTLDGLKNRDKNVSMVFSSSCSVYGDAERFPVTEYMTLRTPTSPYGVTKQFAERMISDTIDAGAKIKCISLRYFNPIGAHESALIGESPLKTNNIVPILTEIAIGKREKLSVFGKDYDTQDGTCVRDYFHVSDLAEAHVAALERVINKQQNADHEVFNLGKGEGTSVLELINTFEKVSGHKIKFEYENRRKGDVAKVWASTKLASEKLNWAAKRDLENMLLTAWNWQKKIR